MSRSIEKPRGPARHRCWLWARGIVLALGWSSPLFATVTVASLFESHAVLQRDCPVKVWGWAEAGESITLRFHGQTLKTVAGATGEWSCTLAPMTASSEGADLTVTGQNEIRLRDVLVGEVWLCSGQSNMEFVVRGPPGSVFHVEQADEEVARADHPSIRQFKVEVQVADAPARSGPGKWEVCTPATVVNFSAIGYFFAREIGQRLGIPIGIVNASCGGSPIESWLSESALRACASGELIQERWRRSAAGEPEVKTMYDAALALRRPGCLFNGMINPLAPYAMRGVLWYQGEANGARPAEYHELLAALIPAWRATFDAPHWPFYFVQLPGYEAPGLPVSEAWAFLREAQAQALSLPATGMAVTIDLGDPGDIHPRNKRAFASRLALLAEAECYRLPVECHGPQFLRVAPQGAAMAVHFAHADGLVIREPAAAALELAGPDRVFHPARGKVAGDVLWVSAPEVTQPIAVRYAWKNAPVAVLFNSAGLPAAPFRSDAWPPRK